MGRGSPAAAWRPPRGAGVVVSGKRGAEGGILDKAPPEGGCSGFSRTRSQGSRNGLGLAFLERAGVGFFKAGAVGLPSSGYGPQYNLDHDALISQCLQNF